MNRRFKRSKLVSASIIFLVILNLTCYGASDPPNFHLTILHTNDFHGYNFTALSREAALIRKIRSEHKNVLYFDAGDTFTRGRFHKKFFGEVEFAVLNALGCSGLTLGNNEFKATKNLTAQNYLLARINQANFPVLCANVRMAKDGSYLPGVRPFEVIKVGGVKIGVLGVTAFRIAGYRQTEGFKVDDPVETAVKIFPKVASESNLVLALTHIGLDQDRQLANRLPGLAAIIGGDSHTALHKPFCQNQIPIVQAGTKGRFLGRLDLYFELKDGNWCLKEYKGELIAVDENIPEDPEIKAIIQSYLQKLKKTAA